MFAFYARAEQRTKLAGYVVGLHSVKCQSWAKITTDTNGFESDGVATGGSRERETVNSVIDVIEVAYARQRL